MAPSSGPFSPASRLTRRTFLKHTAQATAAFGLPTLLPATAFGAKGNTLPSARINLAVIGLGNQGAGHLLGGGWTYVPGGYISRDDVQVRAVCDVQRDRLTRAHRRCNEVYAERFNRPGYTDVAAYSDFREVLARPDIDAVLLALPFHWHATLAVLAMRAGKDVYCEKPIALTVAEAEAVVSTAQRYQRVYQAGTQQRTEYGGKFRTACELIRNERIGTLREIYAYRAPGAFFPTQWTSSSEAPVPAGFDWDRWLGPLPWRPYAENTRSTPSDLLAGDVNWSPHHYDFVQWALNPSPTSPVEIEYDRGRIRYHHATGVVVHGADFPGETTGGQGGACFLGSKGRLAVDRDRLVSYPGHLARTPLPAGSERVSYVNGHQNNFLDCIRTRRQPISHPEVAAASMMTVLAGGLALGLKRSLTWDPTKHRFIGDDIANRHLSYLPRSPWSL
ncbi:MAG: Gfo/Idh/MocA family oxidoreductase [Opitutaceae bacterium]